MAQRCAPTRIQLREVLVEVRGDRAENGFVARFLFLAQLRDEVLEVGAGLGDVLQLLGEVLVALFQLTALGLGQRVGGSDLLEPPLDCAHLPLAGFATRHFFRRHAVRHPGADLLHPRLQELRLTRDQLEVAFERTGAAEGVDAVAPALALELPLLQRGALRCHLPYAGLQLPTHPGRSLFGGARRALQAGQLQLLGLFGGARRLEHARHLFGPRGSGGLRAELREARLRGVQDPSCLGRLPRLRPDGRAPPEHRGQRRLGSRPGGDHVTQPETMPEGGLAASMPPSSAWSLARATTACSACFARSWASAADVSTSASAEAAATALAACTDCSSRNSRLVRRAATDDAASAAARRACSAVRCAPWAGAVSGSSGGEGISAAGSMAFSASPSSPLSCDLSAVAASRSAWASFSERRAASATARRFSTRSSASCSLCSASDTWSRTCPSVRCRARRRSCADCMAARPDWHPPSAMRACSRAPMSLRSRPR